MCTIGKLPWRKFPIYAISQYLGAILGSAVVYGVYLGKYVPCCIPRTSNSTQARSSEFNSFSLMWSLIKGVELLIWTFSNVHMTFDRCFECGRLWENDAFDGRNLVHVPRTIPHLVRRILWSGSVTNFLWKVRRNSCTKIKYKWTKTTPDRCNLSITL